MTKVKTLGLVTALTASLFLAACNKDNTETASTSTPTQTASANIYVKDFNPTQAFINRYTDRSFDFNAALPLSGNFINVLNDLSNSARIVNEAPEDQKANTELRVLATTQARFEDYVKSYAEDSTAFEKDFPNNSFNLNDANFTALLGQLSNGCEANNNYQANIDEIKKLEVKDENGNVVPFPQEVENEIANWNLNFKNTCDLTKSLYRIASQPNFSYAELQAQLAAQAAEQNAPAPAQAPATQENN
ncbi:hypothetical protein CJP74_03245 [Psittacicella melopsittaci]|uniref:Lipoprotein n=1 Tax=Psittacicella melopsittaci TaxID=2028576 RepID=A0A3A1Y6V5_9GAMM|nr:hypothetical protein [Psittacicella melopsittaci]RIY33009.1 hypothetical protein CJP74_03245 [Psittacicella melopsittaci]